MAKAATLATGARPNFSSILKTAPSAVERPKPMPQGTYICMVQGLPRFDKSSKKQTEFVEFTLKFLSAEEDVDKEELAAVGGLGEKTIKDTYYLTETALWRLKDFLSNCGINIEQYETFEAAIEETPSKQIGVFIRHEPSQDGESVFARVGKTMLVE